MKRSSDLLKLEEKLEKRDEKSRVLNKFLLKPIMNVKEINKSSLLEKLPCFINTLKESNHVLLSNPDQLDKANIENHNTNNRKEQLVKMNLGLGVFEMKKKKEEETKLEIKISKEDNKVIQNPYLDEKEEQLLNFIAKNWVKKTKHRKRIHLKKKLNKI